ncbi:efflux RND transporter periplasmic adaptor subunit [Poseidonibacter antarcticus]|uniref:efflux RND transporter periplasmic adaptor subunit n=1 Tax=Poseidonibacter antarcticus TaxID=2478538 RepID=UPI000EF5060D|nr:efflux RND transporter periplasmic adaptor subunit [Poseidonibacter antarcticus]
MKKIFKILIPFIIILGTIGVVYIIFDNPPEAKKQKAKVSKIKVEVKKLVKQDFLISLDSFGTAQPSVQTTLTSQVSGKVIYVNDKFKNGAYFKKGDLLVQIEDLDYISDEKIAQAQLVLAKQALLEEQAKSKQAKEDWEKFNIKGKPNSLVLRVPQLQSAKANLMAAQAQLEKAKLNSKRTKILAPYDGRVIEKNVSIAQVLASNTQIGTIFSSDVIEVRLPIKNKDLNLIDIDNKANIVFNSEITNTSFKGKIARSESSIDTNTKQLYLIAEIKENSKKIKIGEYLKAKIQAKKLKDVMVIPNDSVYQSSYVYLEKDGVLQRNQIEILWQDDNNTLVKSGLKQNDNLVLTTLGVVSSGTKVDVLDENGSIKQNDVKRKKGKRREAGQKGDRKPRNKGEDR